MKNKSPNKMAYNGEKKKEWKHIYQTNLMVNKAQLSVVT
jgi:hypothetical protein